MTLVASAIVTPGAALADPPKPTIESPRDQARKLAMEGERLFDEGDYKTAILRLQQADGSFAAPTIKLLWAEAHEKLGQLLQAQALYQRVADEKLTVLSSKEFRDAQRTASEALARLEKAIPTMTLVIVGDPLEVASLTLDGAAVAAARWGEPIRVNPGEHALTVEIAGRPATTRTIALKEGQSQKVQVQTAVPAAAPVRSAAAPAVEPGGGSYAVPLAAFGVGAAGLVAGAVTGAMAMSSMQGFREQCGTALQCPPSFQKELNDAKVLGHVSTVGFAIAGVGAVLGTTFVVWQAKGGKTNASVRIGPLGGAVTGAF